MALTRPPALLLPTLVVAVVAGCLEDSASADYHAAGQNGSFALGWAYDGDGVLSFDGFITIHADHAANTGEAVVAGNLNDQVWTIQFDEFAEQSGRPFQDGGVASNLDEHGDTKVGDSSIPKVHVDLAAWGEALVAVDGEPVPDPLTGQDRWVAHFMVMLTGVRDDQDHGIHTVDGGVYDPAAPAGGKAVEGDSEIHLVLKSHATSPPNATEVSEVAQSTTPTFNREHTYDNKYQNSEFNVTIAVRGTFAPTNDIEFRLEDPDGNTIKSLRLPRGNLREDTLSAPLPTVGQYRLVTRGQGVQPGYTITGAITPPSNVVMNFWWEDVLFGNAAEAFEATASAPSVDGPTSGPGNTTAGPKAF